MTTKPDSPGFWKIKTEKNQELIVQVVNVSPEPLKPWLRFIWNYGYYDLDEARGTWGEKVFNKSA